MSDLGHDPVREPRPKRIKIDVACDTCRTRKVKCDGRRPSCGNCARKLALQGTCKYSQSATSSGPKPITDSRQGEPGSESQGSFITPSRPSSNAFAGSNRGGRAGPTQPVVVDTPRRASLARQAQDSDPGDISSPRALSIGSRAPASVHTHSPSVIDSMTAVVDEGTTTREYFAHPLPPYKGTTPTPQNTINDAYKVLPTRRQADHLLGMYWLYVDPLYPFLDKARWEKSYRAIFDGVATTIDEQIFLASLNVIFALSSQLVESQDPDQREESSRVYFDRAQGLLPLNTWEPASIELLQYLLLTSQYLQSTERPHQTWMVVGSAVRIAQGIGLHLSETSAEHCDPKERELLRRIWYGCVLMDRMVSVTHGRPAMISTYVASTVPLPNTPIDRPEAATGVLDSSSTDATFFVKSVQLYELIHRTIQSLYYGARCKSVLASNDGGDSGDANNSKTDLEMVMQFDAALDKWDRGLPGQLRWTYSQPRDQVTQRQAVVLYIRFLHARILLLRPVLASFCLSSQGGELVQSAESLEVRTLKECAIMCVSTAQKIISVLLKYQAIDGSIGYLPAWWYRVYYVYTAATVLIAAKLRPEVLPEPDFNQTWGKPCQSSEIMRGLGNPPEDAGQRFSCFLPRSSNPRPLNQGHKQ
uniref:Zn(2)-C6 fungal-type domain-containing protein n=1 Tax=Bionectria ochroleuca TaxID=29856 RepID=A0A8H7N652_BIOOC